MQRGRTQHGPASERGPASRRARARFPALGLLAGAVLLLLVLAVAAGAGGPVEMGQPRVGLPLGGAGEGLGQLGEVDEQAQQQEPAPLGDPDRTPWALILLGIVATAAAAVVLRTLRPPRDEPRRAAAPAGTHPPQLDEQGAVPLAALRAAAATARADLASAVPGQAGDAVVAAWLALERAAAAGGTPRHPAQTPTEFTAALLRRHDADGEATGTLLRLYHRARFGAAPLPTDAAAAAGQALETIATSLGGNRRGS